MREIFPLQSDSRIDQDLVGWFTLHRGAWFGTAPELLVAVKATVDVSGDWPQSPRALYAHIELHTGILQSLGVAVLLPDGSPRMISLQSCQHEEWQTNRRQVRVEAMKLLVNTSEFGPMPPRTSRRGQWNVCDDTEAFLTMLRKYESPDEVSRVHHLSEKAYNVICRLARLAMKRAA